MLCDFDKGVKDLTGKLPEQMAASQMWRAVRGKRADGGFFASLEWAKGAHLGFMCAHCALSLFLSDSMTL